MESIGYDKTHSYMQDEKDTLKHRIYLLRTEYGSTIPSPPLENLIHQMQRITATEVQGLILEYNTLLQQYQIESRRNASQGMLVRKEAGKRV